MIAECFISEFGFEIADYFLCIFQSLCVSRTLEMMQVICEIYMLNEAAKIVYHFPLKGGTQGGSIRNS